MREVSDVFDDLTIRFLHGGCSLLVGSVSPETRRVAHGLGAHTVVLRGVKA